MLEVVKTMKLHIHASDADRAKLELLTKRYAEACTYVSKYVFDHGFVTNFMKL